MLGRSSRVSRGFPYLVIAKADQLAFPFFYNALALVERLLTFPGPDPRAPTPQPIRIRPGSLKFSETQPLGLSSGGRKANCRDAGSWYVNRLELWRRIAHLSGEDVTPWKPAKVAEELQFCEAALPISHLSCGLGA